MLVKMKDLLDPLVKDEVDYEEAVENVSNVWKGWMSCEAAGKRAFIPTVSDHDECRVALKIFFHAVEEEKLIPYEFCNKFGKEGLRVSNELVSMIGDRDKKCLPFLNMCLCTWIEHLREDPDLWADVYQFDFDEWVDQEMSKSVSNTHQGKTSYELMMLVFGEKHGKLPLNTTTTPSTMPTTTSPTQSNAIQTAQSSSKSRSSKIKKISGMVTKRLIKSNTLRRQY